MKSKLITLAIVVFLMIAAWQLGRATMKQEAALTTFMDQTVYLGYIQKNDMDSVRSLIRISNDTLLLESVSKSYPIPHPDFRDKWLQTYGVLRASLPELPDELFDPEQEKKVNEVLEKFTKLNKSETAPAR